MAMDPGRRMITLGFSGGYIYGAKGLLEYLFGSLTVSWRPVRDAGPRKRPYGSRQMSNAAAGEVIFLRLVNGQIYSLRTTATHRDFLDELILHARDKVLAAWSQRGTLYGPTLAELGSEA
jgi:hypothetical protein